jgi:hypothetical protein
MSAATDVVDAQIEAYRARDIERFISFYAEDMSVVLFDGTAMFPSKYVLREQYAKLFADSPDLGMVISGRVAAGDFVVDEAHISGMNFGSMPSEMTVLSVYRISGGKIAKLMLLF